MPAWYCHYIGDYTQKTAHLTLEQHGAYRLMLDHYYGTGQPLPSNFDMLYKICRAFTETEKKAVCYVAQNYFAANGDNLHNKKCDEILKKMGALSAKRRQAAKSKGKNRSAIAQQMQSNSSANATTITTTITTTDNIKKNNKKDFDEFWNFYPRKTSKAKAEISYKTAIKKIKPDELLIKLKGYKFSDDPQYIPHAATWLNGERWEDVQLATSRPSNQPPVRKSQGSFEEEKRRLLGEI